VDPGKVAGKAVVLFSAEAGVGEFLGGAAVPFENRLARQVG
jgi:hypothetical protein